MPPEFEPFAEEGVELNDEKIEEQKVEASPEFEAASEIYNNTVAGVSISILFGTIFLILLTRKLDGKLTASWWAVFTPILIVLGLKWALNLYRCACGRVLGEEILVEMPNAHANEGDTSNAESKEKDDDNKEEKEKPHASNPKKSNPQQDADEESPPEQSSKSKTKPSETVANVKMTLLKHQTLPVGHLNERRKTTKLMKMVMKRSTSTKKHFALGKMHTSKPRKMQCKSRQRLLLNVVHCHFNYCCCVLSWQRSRRVT